MFVVLADFFSFDGSVFHSPLDMDSIAVPASAVNLLADCSIGDDLVDDWRVFCLVGDGFGPSNGDPEEGAPGFLHLDLLGFAEDGAHDDGYAYALHFIIGIHVSLRCPRDWILVGPRWLRESFAPAWRKTGR